MQKTIHLIFKTHLDLGFTGYAKAVEAQYHEHFIPMALATGEHFLREDPDRPAFVWTTGSWLIWRHLNTQSSDKVRRLERGIENGIIAWHALPFTTHTELLSRPLFAEGLSISKELDARFGRRTRASKMTDVPGHTLGAVEVMAEQGIEFLHLGVNAASPVPDLPPLFRWQAPGGAEIVVLYQNSYGTTFVADGMNTGIAFAHTMDNIGPQSVGHVVETHDRLREDTPDADFVASTLDAYWSDLRAIRETLPVVTAEIGDTWIHGTGSAPRRLSRFLACQRGFDRFAASPTPARRAFGRKLIEVAEHTWGVDIKTYLRDETAWDRPDFEAARRSDPRFAFTEGAWAEQDAIIDEAVAHLDEQDAREIDRPPRRPEPTGIPVDMNERVRIGRYAARFDSGTGALLSLSSDRSEVLASRAGGRGLFAITQRAYSADEVEAYLSSYLTHRYRWGVQDHTKPGLATARTQRSGVFEPAGAAAWQADERLVVTAGMPLTAVADFGAPERVTWVYEDLGTGLAVTLFLAGKAANRQPEAGFCHFEPEIDGGALRVEKMGLMIDPTDVARHGNRQLHSVKAVEARTPHGHVRLTPLDCALFGLSSLPFLLHATDLPDPGQGGRFVLYNNKWGTNFSMWSEGDFAFRFMLEHAPLA